MRAPHFGRGLLVRMHFRRLWIKTASTLLFSKNNSLYLPINALFRLKRAVMQGILGEMREALFAFCILDTCVLEKRKKAFALDTVIKQSEIVSTLFGNKVERIYLNADRNVCKYGGQTPGRNESAKKAEMNILFSFAKLVFKGRIRPI